MLCFDIGRLQVAHAQAAVGVEIFQRRKIQRFFLLFCFSLSCLRLLCFLFRRQVAVHIQLINVQIETNRRFGKSHNAELGLERAVRHFSGKIGLDVLFFQIHGHRTLEAAV